MPRWLFRSILLLSTLLPGRLARRGVRALGGAAYVVFGRTAHRRTSAIIELALGESPREARRISLDHFRRTCLLHCDHQYFATCKSAHVSRIAERVEVIGPKFVHDYSEIVEDFVEGGERIPIVLATIHMGSYLRGVAKLVQISPSDRRLSIIKMRERTRQEDLAYRHFERAGVEVNVIRLSDRPALRAREELRQGNALVIFFDAPPSFGTRRSAVVRFFDRGASFPAGPATLAILSGAVILPVVSYADADGRDILEIETPIVARLREGEDLERATARLMQELATRAERWIRRAPGEWLLWQTLPELWDAARSSSEASVPDPPPR